MTSLPDLTTPKMSASSVLDFNCVVGVSMNQAPPLACVSMNRAPPLARSGGGGGEGGGTGRGVGGLG